MGDVIAKLTNLHTHYSPGVRRMRLDWQEEELHLLAHDTPAKAATTPWRRSAMTSAVRESRFLFRAAQPLVPGMEIGGVGKYGLKNF